MLIRLFAKIRRHIASVFYPTLECDVRLYFAQFDAMALRTRTLILPVFGILCALIAQQWVSWPAAALWYCSIVLISQVQRICYRRIQQKRSHATAHAHQRTTILAELPLHLAWFSFIPLCWQANNLYNNAALMIFMLVSTGAAIRIYGPCILQVLLFLLISLPLYLFYTLDNGSGMGWVMRITQICYLGFLGTLALEQYRQFRRTFLRQDTIETLLAQLRETRNAAERSNRAKSTFLAGMSHELRTPLNAIIGFSDLIRQGVFGPVQPEKYSTYINDIHASGQHLLNLINDLLDLSKIEAGKRELKDTIIDLSKQVTDAALFVRLQAEDAGVSIRFDIENELHLIADQRAIRQILINLLSNAIKYSPKGETVTVFARHCDGWLEMGVTDHGVGMDENGIEKAIQPYGQINPHASGRVAGTGLGLPIAKALTEAHDATFHISSAIGAGTTVWGRFPPSRSPHP